MTNNKKLNTQKTISNTTQYEVESMKQEKENERNQQTDKEKLDRLIEAGSNPARSIMQSEL
jgi:hypothetical protein